MKSQRARLNVRTTLEHQRIRAAKFTLFGLLIVFCCLGIWQCAEQAQAQSNLGSFAEVLVAETGSHEILDPLSIEQEGVELVRTSEGGSILWYQSSWDTTQSKTLLQRALVMEGWQPTGSESEQVLSFVYTSSATAAGGCLYASFYGLASGCSILIEVL